MSLPVRFTTNDSSSLAGGIDLDTLYSRQDRERHFERKIQRFLQSDKSNESIFQLEGSLLHYMSEQIVPDARDDRPPLLLLLGNPASHSVDEGMFFSYENDGKEHRFWKNILKPAGILDLVMDDRIDPKERNRVRKDRLLRLDYESPFRVGLAVYFSIPSGSSGEWSGVAGLRKLFGIAALREIETCEKKRVKGLCERYLGREGTVVTFQKDAWNGLKRPNDPDYSLDRAKTGALVGKTSWSENYSLFGAPPTRLSGPCRRVLAKFWL